MDAQQADAEHECKNSERQHRALGCGLKQIRRNQADQPLPEGREVDRRRRRTRCVSQRSRDGGVDREPPEQRPSHQGAERGRGEECTDKEQQCCHADAADGALVGRSRDAYDELGDDERNDGHPDGVHEQLPDRFEHRDDHVKAWISDGGSRRSDGEAEHETDQNLEGGRHVNSRHTRCPTVSRAEHRCPGLETQRLADAINRFADIRP